MGSDYGIMKILIVEDDPLIATVMERMLRRDHEVTVISDLHQVDAERQYDVVFCDVGHHEPVTIQEQLLRTAERLVLMSGATPADPILRRWIAAGDVLWMPKPFPAQRVRELASLELEAA